MRSILLTTLVIVLTGPAAGAQKPGEPRNPRKDKRDSIELRSGKTIRCRVASVTEPETVLYLDGATQRTISRKKVKSIRTVRMALDQWFEQRNNAPRTDVAAQWKLVGTADAAGLAALARLQAMHVAMLDPAHDGANERVGNHKRSGTWRWRKGLEPAGKLMKSRRAATSENYDLESEHWILSTDVELRRSVNLLFDLEFLHATFMRELGEDLGAREIIWPMRVRAFKNRPIPKLSSSSDLPYLRPGHPLASDDESFSTFIEGKTHPLLIFDVATEQIINKALLTTKNTTLSWGRDPDRFAPWLEVGLGRWYGARAAGDPGYVEFGPQRIDQGDAHAVAKYRATSLENLIGLRLAAFHEPIKYRPLYWAECATFVAYRMDHDTVLPARKRGKKGDIKGRDALVGFARSIFRDGTQNRSDKLDDFLGVKIEKLEAPWIEWTCRRAGIEPQKRKQIRSRRGITLAQLPRGFVVW